MLIKIIYESFYLFIWDISDLTMHIVCLMQIKYVNQHAENHWDQK